MDILRSVAVTAEKGSAPSIMLGFGGDVRVSIVRSSEKDSFVWCLFQDGSGCLDSGISASACAVVKRFLPAWPWDDGVRCLCRTAVSVAAELERNCCGLYVYGLYDMESER